MRLDEGLRHDSPGAAEGRPVTACPDCGVEVGVVGVVGKSGFGRLQVDLARVPTPTLVPLVWVELFSGHPPSGIILPPGSLHQVHRCAEAA